MDLQKTKEKILLFLIPFLIISFFSFNPNPHIDESLSLYCSKFYFEDCIEWDVHLPTFYFFLNYLSLISFKVEFLRIILAIFSSVSIYFIIKSISIFRKLSFLEKIFLAFLISFIPLFYSSTFLRPYIFSLLFSSLSLYYFLLYLKNKKFSILVKSLFFDFFASIFFIFNFLLIIGKFFVINNNERKTFIFLVSVFILILLPFIFILTANTEVKEYSISWYKDEEEFKFFWFNFPVDLFKHLAFEESEKGIINIVFAKLSQIIFFLPLFFAKREIKILYIWALFSIILISLMFYLKDIYLTFSRHFVAFAIFIFTLSLIIFPKPYLPLLLVLYFIFQTDFVAENLINESLYGNWKEAYNYLPNNSQVFVYPFQFSSIFWYFEKINKKNIEILDTVETDLSKNIEEIIFRKWLIDKPIIRYYKLESLSDKIKVFVDKIPISCYLNKTFESNFYKIYICQ
ncbi:MAG: hypothetical protein QXQ14_03030 [Candidatus Aenigmatarchaeota archaeon]